MRSNTMTGPVREALTDVRSTVGCLVASVDEARRSLGHDELSASLAAVRSLQARLEYVALSLVAEVDRRGSHLHDGALSAAAWVRMHSRVSPRDAASDVRAARVLMSGELPATTEALRDGDIGIAHVRVIADGVADAPAGAAALIETEALEAARRSDPREVAGIMRMFRHALDPDAADAAALARYDRRGFSAAATLDGMVAGTFLADEVSGSLIMTAVDAASPLVKGDGRTAAQRRLDAITDICRRYLGSPAAPMVGGGHAHVIVTVDGAAAPISTEPVGVLAPPGSPGGTLSWVGRIGGSTARRVACDADVTVVRVGPGGDSEVVGRQQRFFTWAQRKAMIARDGDRCVVPFCDRPVSWSDGHHLRAWELGGPTTVDNGALPCAAHHTMLHEGGWSLLRTPDGAYSLRHGGGKTIGPESHSAGHCRPPPTFRR